MTPYAGPVPAERFLQGAALDLAAVTDPPAELPAQLQRMRDGYHVNAVTVYGLERWTGPRAAYRDVLFRELDRLGLRIVVRIEAYAADTFAFTPADVDQIATAHDELFRYLADPGRSGLIEYFALNMPVDDARVQRRLGGINSTVARERQVEFAAALVARVRGTLAGLGVPRTPVYLGVFYGWDNTYDLPSYGPARADGYFLTNYSYPGREIADERSAEPALINEDGLRTALGAFTRQYPDAPAVIEYGFHTVEHNGGAVPAQTAGLVRSAAAKQRALLATTAFYCANYPAVRGTMYFGYNVFKTEGEPPAVLDYALDYTRSAR
jgi:hypothetical protein